MNDFTKEELQIILDWSGELGSEYGTKGTPEEQRLDRKIQSMIDNYPKETEMDRKNKIYREQILPAYGNDHNKVPPFLEPDYKEGWK